MAITRRRSKRSTNSSGAVSELNALVAALIKENAKLKRQLARIEAKPSPTSASRAQRVLKALARKVERALASTGSKNTVGRRATSRRTKTTGASRSRKPASPETQAKRLAALARARAARAARRAAQTGAATG